MENSSNTVKKKKAKRLDAKRKFLGIRFLVSGNYRLFSFHSISCYNVILL